MDIRGNWLRDAWVGLAYFALASISIYTTRFDGGLAHLWVGAAFLITVLGRRPRRKWASAIAWSAAGSILATGIVGAGWVMALPFALANMAEALVAALVLRSARSALLPLGSPRWFFNLVVAAGVLGPLAMVAFAALPLMLYNGQDFAETALRVMTGHGLSNLIFIPIFKLFATSNSGLWKGRSQRKSGILVPTLFAFQLVVTLAVFVQEGLPLLFLPLLPVIAIVFRGSSRWSAYSLLLLAVISSSATLLGNGPIHLEGLEFGHKVQLLEVYLLAAVLTIVPIAAQIRRTDWLSGRVRDSEARYRMLADHSGDVIMHSDELGIVRFVSPSIERVGGYRPADLIGSDSMEIIHPDFHDLVRDHYAFALSGQGQDSRFEYKARRSDGRWCWFESECRGLTDPGGPRGVVSIIRDISERKEREQLLAIAAMTDSLTGLPNRRAFREAAAGIIADRRVRDASIAILDLDHFKRVNDTYGHEAGDEVLQSFAAIAQSLRRDDDLIARMGGEEFVLLLPHTVEGDAIKLCERIRKELAGTVCLTSAGPISITVSGGVAALGPDGLDAALKRADIALYKAKNQGRDRLIRSVAA